MTADSKTNEILANKWAIVLCGGRGTRLGAITDNAPKPLVEVHNKPLIWYVILTLYKRGFRKFLFPLGYKGEMVEAFVRKEFDKTDCELRFVNTGEADTPIGRRIDMVKNYIHDYEDFFLLNGDTFFDFDISSMYQLHKRKMALLTLSSIEIISNYGVIIEKNGNIVDFAREKKVSYFSFEGDQKSSEGYRGYVNAGLVWLNKSALSYINLKNCVNFEQELYPVLIRKKFAAHYKIEGDWYAIDTQKDLHVLNCLIEDKDRIGEKLMTIKQNLSSRYSYKTKYYESPKQLRDKIIEKTVIPHQVEIQPGPKTGNLCWLKCPYCYGNTAKETNERLDDDRYLEIMQQIAEGGVTKVVYAGYATDPLNYEGISDLLQVALNFRQIFGFHTKAIEVSDRFINQITHPKITPLSYFSVSVDAGSNEIYNKVHGMAGSSAKIYGRVFENIKRISEARKRTNAPLDISATYLLTNANSEKSEIIKSINDLKDAGVDLIRFTFPQIPRGYAMNEKSDAYIPNRQEISQYMALLRPIIEAETTDSCHVLIMDIDDQYDIYNVHRTLPCFARFIFPSIGYDGWLSHCSESCAPHFREMAIGNLNEVNFWDLYYNYDVKSFLTYFQKQKDLMNRLSCRCDRKEHVVNSRLTDSRAFNE